MDPGGSRLFSEPSSSLTDLDSPFDASGCSARKKLEQHMLIHSRRRSLKEEEEPQRSEVKAAQSEGLKPRLQALNLKTSKG